MSKSITVSEFIHRANRMHDNKYDYSKSVYAGSKNKIEIVCVKHGSFFQRASKHLFGDGCPRCANNVLLTLNEFIKKANEIHADRYDYSKVIYKGHAYNVKIICPIHGEFVQKANKHLSGDGCPLCAEENKGWSFSKWEKAGLNSNKFYGFKFYIIKCWNEDEKFFKVGKTFNNLSRRFKTKLKMPYKWEIVLLKEGDARTISELENTYKHNNIDNKYNPKIQFKGMSECFFKINKNEEDEEKSNRFS